MSSKTEIKKIIVEPIGLQNISTNDIDPNPQNPRMFFPEDTLSVLCESISKVGILVPLLVYKDKKGKYVILDGERRWRCALKLSLPNVPVNIIAEPDTITNLLTMFNIHNIREAWQVMPAALKLEVIMRILKTKNERKLSELTGLKVGNIRRLKRLLTYPKKYQDLILKNTSTGDITADFFSELFPIFGLIKNNIPEINQEFSQEDIIEKLLEKFRRGIIKAAREFRILAKIIRAIKKGINKDKIENIVKKVISDPELSINQAFEITVRDKYETDSLIRQCDNLLKILSSDYILINDPSTIETLRTLQKKIADVLSSAK
jgi:ParB/RepB/Spo0J family partition protein